MDSGDARRRAIRSFVQVGLVSAVIAMLQTFKIINWDANQTVAVMAVATPVVTFIQNLLEDSKGQTVPLLPK